MDSYICYYSYLIFYWLHDSSYQWRLVIRSPYTSLESHGEGVYSPFKRLLLYIIILITMCAFLNLTSQKQRFYTYIGRRTMFVYLLHGIVIGIIRGFGLYPFKDNISIFTYLFLIVTSLIIVFVLSSKVVCLSLIHI